LLGAPLENQRVADARFLAHQFRQSFPELSIESQVSDEGRLEISVVQLVDERPRIVGYILEVLTT